MLLIFLAAGCSKNELESIYDSTTNCQRESSRQVSLVPLNEAMASLYQFLTATNVSQYPTRASVDKQIASIDIYYSNNKSTRSVGALPDAYIVNFEDNQGYVVLGANTNVDPIVAVTDCGHIDPITLSVRENQESVNMSRENFRAFEGVEELYPVADEGAIVTQAICNAFIRIDDGDEEIPGGGGTGGGGSSHQYHTCSTILHTDWSQGYWGSCNVYNKYCYKNDHQFAYAGCSTAALAMIIAGVEFPTFLYVNNTLVDYDAMKNSRLATQLTLEDQEYVSLLYGAIFNNVNKAFVLEEGTCITPAAIKDLMSDMGFANVEMLSGSNITNEMLNCISTMMLNRRPVFISAIEGLLGGHSWVIDGASYNSSENYLLHCNWGWGGADNGYYSPSCFNPPSLGNEFSWHFRVISYDIPSTSITCSMGCLP